MRCPHTNFKAHVVTHRTDNPPQRFYIEVHVECGDCHMPFRFVGVKPGSVLSGDTLSRQEPLLTSADDCELRVPIACGPRTNRLLVRGTEEQEFEALKADTQRLQVVASRRRGRVPIG